MPSGERGIRSFLRTFRTVLVGLLLTLLLALGAGCGDDDSSGTDGFSKGYNAAIARLARVNQELGSLPSSAKPRSSNAIAREFDTFADGLANTRAQLSRLAPPEQAVSQFAALLAALDESVGASRRAARAARQIKPARQRRAVRQLQRAAEEVTSAEDALRRAVERG
jgi:hypothetical protein